MNIIEERRRKAWDYATKLIFDKVIRAHANGTLYIYADRLYGKDYSLTADIAMDAIFDTMEALREAWEREGVRPSKERFAQACPDKAIGAVVAGMWRNPFRYWD